MVKDLRKRLIPALIAAFVAIYLIRFPAGFALIVAIATIGCAYEMYKISVKISPQYKAGYLVINALMAVYGIYYILYHNFPDHFPNVSLSEVPIKGFIIYIGLLFFLYFKKAGSALIPIVNLVYPFMGLYCMTELGYVAGSYQTESLLLLLFCVWSADMTAYFFGNLIGGKKLAPSISPNKTISGWIGALIGVAVVTFIYSSLSPFMSYNVAVIWTLAIWLSASLGDLFESYLKREADIKDSGVFLPGHGGFLDRLDSLIFAAPFAYFILKVL